MIILPHSVVCARAAIPFHLSINDKAFDVYYSHYMSSKNSAFNGCGNYCTWKPDKA